MLRPPSIVGTRMLWIKRLVLAFVVLGIGVFALQFAASESGEVVVVSTTDAEGKAHETRLWVVEYEGSMWLRAGMDSNAWYGRVAQQPDIIVQRDGVAGTYRAVAVPEATQAIQELMREKYGWGDQVISAMIDRSRSVALRLDPR